MYFSSTGQWCEAQTKFDQRGDRRMLHANSEKSNREYRLQLQIMKCGNTCEH